MTRDFDSDSGSGSGSDFDPDHDSDSDSDPKTDTETETEDAPANDQPLLSLPPALRDELKIPLGPVESDPVTLLEDAGSPVVAVGDVVTYHLLEAGHPPDVAVVDGYTERREVDERIRATIADAEDAGTTLEVTNPPATITADLVRALLEALETPEPATVLVDGEEDLAALPAIVAAPDGASVVYGQPGEGMVLVTVAPDVREEVSALLERFDGEYERFRAILE